MTYATDGKCHNANTGTYGHECGKPAQWIAQKDSGYRSGFCDHCKNNGSERTNFKHWYSTTDKDLFGNMNAAIKPDLNQLKMEI